MHPCVRHGLRAAALLCALALAPVAHAATSGDYRTYNSGDWSNQAVWQRYDGSSWINVSTSPTSADGAITIRDSITVTTSVTVDQVTVNAGRQITIKLGKTLTLADGADTDLTINGTVLNQGTLALTGSATWAVNDGGTYIHNTVSAVATSLDAATLGAASTIIYRGSDTLDPPSSLGGRTYGHLRYESTSGAWSFNPTTGQPITILGDFFLGTGVTMTAANTGVMTFGGNYTIDGTLTNSGGTQKYTFTGAAATVAGAGAITFEQFSVPAGADLTLAAPVTLASGFTATVDGTLEANAALTANSTPQVNGTLRLNGGSISSQPTYGAASTLVLNATGAVGNEWGDSGSTAGPGVPQNVSVLSGTATMPAAARTCPGTLSLDGGSLTLGGADLTVGQSLALTSGVLATGGNTVILASGGTVTRGTGQVNGLLRKTVPTGAPSVTFEIGDGARYTPVKLDFASVTTAGPVTAGTTTGDNPQLATSKLDGAKSVNRWWTLTPGSFVFTTCDAKFTFDPADVDAGATPANFIVGRYDSAAWSYPALGNLTTTSTQATNLTAFGDFALGETIAFTITATAGANGSINPSGAVSVTYGNNKNFTIAPNPSYYVEDVLVDGVSVGAVDSYKFFDVRANHTIAVSFALGTLAYRSAASGNWNSPTTWEVFDGAAWVAASALPDPSLAGPITIRSPHVVTCTDSQTVDELTVDAGATLTVNEGEAVAVQDGPGTDLVLNGTLHSMGTCYMAFTSNGEVNDGGNYIIYAASNGQLANLVLSVHSTVTYRTEDGVGPFHGDMTSYGNLVIDGTGVVGFQGNLDLTVRGDCLILGASMHVTATGTLRFAGDVTCLSGYFDLDQNDEEGHTQICEFTGVGKTVSGSFPQMEQVKIPTGADITIEGQFVFLPGFESSIDGTLRAQGGDITADGTVRVKGTVRLAGGPGKVKGTGSFSYTAGATLIYDGDVTMDAVSWPSANGPTKVTVSSGAKLNMGAAARTVSGTFRTAGIVKGNSGALTLPGVTQIDPGGSFNFTPTYTTGSTLVYNSSATVGSEWKAGSVAGLGVPQNVTIQPGVGAAVSLPATDRTCPGTLTLTNGTLATGNVTMIAAGSVVRTGGWVNGRLQKPVAAGAVSQVFAIGDSTRYAPVQVNYTSVSVGGTVTASTTAGDHPSIASSPLNPAKTANRVWTLTNVGTVFDSAAVTVTFDPLDVDAGADPAVFLVGRFTAPSTWTAPAVGARTATSTQATGLTAFGDFAVGEAPAPVAVGDPWLVSTAIPAATALLPAAPNPAHGVAHLRFALHERGPVRLAVYDIRGRLVRTLLRADAIAGTHGLVWDTRDASGHAVGAGLYLLRLETGGRAVTGRLQIVR